MQKLLTLFILCAGVCLGVQAADNSTLKQQFPAIAEYGGALDLPHGAEPLDPARQYQLVFDLTALARDPQTPLAGLQTAARFLNLAALAGVPKGNLHLVMVMHGAATGHALDNAHYQAQYGTDNPSLPLIQALNDYGVQIYVCGQALHGSGFEEDWLSPQIHMAVAALTVIVNKQLEGYALMSY